MDFNSLIKEICLENNIKCTNLSSDWIVVLEKDNVKKFIAGYKFGVNDHAFGEILDDKFATYELLRLYDIPVCEHNIFYSKNNKNSYTQDRNNFDYIKNLFDKYNHDIVVKINNGTCGINVNRITNINDLKEFYEHFTNNSSYSICPFYNIENEYRVIVLNNKIELIYKKELPVVYGNNKNTIRELLEKFNPKYFKNINNDELNSVLGLNEKYIYSWKFNLSNGSRPSLAIKDEEKKQILEIINNIISKINVGFCSIDIIKTLDNKYMVLEINSGIMMKNFAQEVIDGYDIAKNIYTKAILEMFENN